MTACAVESRATRPGLSLLTILVLSCAASRSRASDAAPRLAAATSAAVMAEPLAHRGIRAWGMRFRDLERAMTSLGPQEHATIARMLEEGLRGIGERRAAAQKAHQLVPATLMRESRLFASVLSIGMR